MANKLLIQKNGQEIPVSVVYNQNGGGTIQFWKGTPAQYKSLTSEQITELNNNNTIFFLEEA